MQFNFDKSNQNLLKQIKGFKKSKKIKRYKIENRKKKLPREKATAVSVAEFCREKRASYKEVKKIGLQK